MVMQAESRWLSDREFVIFEGVFKRKNGKRYNESPGRLLNFSSFQGAFIGEGHLLQITQNQKNKSLHLPSKLLKCHTLSHKYARFTIPNVNLLCKST